jgi:hypothetical protein
MSERVVFRGTIAELLEWLRLQPAWQSQREVVVYDDATADSKPLPPDYWETAQ